MSRTRKYLKGPKLTVPELFSELVAGHYVFERHKPQHPSWLGSQPSNYLAAQARSGVFSKAILNPDYVETEIDK